MRRCLPACLALALLSCGGSAATPTPASCAMGDGRPARDALREEWQAWNDALLLAQRVPQAERAARVAELQRLRGDVAAERWPDCATRAAALMLRSMNRSLAVMVLLTNPATPDAQRADELLNEGLREASELDAELASLR
jgi:hypothetical protein